jgi:membrane protein YdbS with pleckstrin-like domain
MEPFNPQITEDFLPKVEQLEFQSLENEYLKVLLWSAAIRCMIFLLILGGAYLFKSSVIPLFLVYVVALWYAIYVVWTFTNTVKGFQHKGYALRAKDIVYKTGWLWKSITTTPFNRVQHISIDQGPIERQFNLARLKVFTAGGSSSDLSIPGLYLETANELKEFIVRKTQEDEEE